VFIILVHRGSVFFERMHLLMGFDQTDHLLGFEFRRQVESKFVDVERSDAKELFVASRDYPTDRTLRVETAKPC
jgi:hypothetical protein